MDYRGQFEDGVIRPSQPMDLPGGTEVEFHVVANGTVSSFWNSPNLDELADAQRVRSWHDPEELAGDWPAEDRVDEFLEQVRRGRR